MASTKNNFETPKFILSPHQQELLFAALNSNRTPANSGSLQQPKAATGMAPQSFDNSPLVAPGSAIISNLDDSPFNDYDYDFNDTTGDFGDFDFSTLAQGQMIGQLPKTVPLTDSDGLSHEKRGLSEDDVDDDEHDGKRREGSEEKGAKKPGRKPLTSEPTSKRKAQNRAAQRAFRERKEKHLKDLETKVQDLEKASESANHENLILRAKVENMAAELKEYKKRLSLNGPITTQPTPPIPSYLKDATAHAFSNPQDVNFSFEFPRFGRLPGPPAHKSDSHIPQSKSTGSPGAAPSRSTSFASNISPTSQNAVSFGLNQSTPNLQGDVQNDVFFVPSSPENGHAKRGSDTARSSTDSGVNSNSGSNGNNTSQSSPASSNSHGGPSSSCGTSPEPYNHSPALKALDSTLGTIGEEEPKLDSNATESTFCEKLSMVCGDRNNPVPRTMPVPQEPTVTLDHAGATTHSGFSPTNNYDYNSIDWFAQQNNNAFDPQLFGDYREPQDTILAGGLYDDTFFNEAFALPTDLGSPFNFDNSAVTATTPKKDLMAQIDDKLNEDEEVVPAESEMLTCTNMWDKIQACPRVQNGEIDIDALCTELQLKAKCSGEGPVIQEKDFKKVLNTMFAAKGLAPCND